ncbi:MAG: class I SAM-dependent methyltransferase [candidate division NC10 bacterium]|nr:class I SAM-dependent methyltransferase [candidate division NC10 bacterium]
MGLRPVPCNLCKTDDSRLLLRVKRSQDHFTLRKCRRCGLVFLNPRPESEDLARYYAEHYDYDGFRRDRESLINRCRGDLDWIRKFKPKGSLLEVGCMYGFLLALARDAGFDCHGVEISKKVATHAREELHLDVHAGALESAHFPEGSFDVVFMSHVIEHLEDPLGALEKTVSLLKKDGVLLLKCPNFDSLMARITRHGWWWIAPPEHLYHFTPRSLGKSLGRAGFRKVTVETSRGDLSYLRYLTVGILKLLPVTKGFKARYRATIDATPDHLSQRYLLSAYNACGPLVRVIHKLRLGEEMLVVASMEHEGPSG